MDALGEKMLQQTTVLFVEDESSIRIKMSKGLSERLKDVYTARDGIDAIEKFEKYLPDILITDLDLPGMSGFELALKVRKEYPETSIIVISKSSDSESILRTIDIRVEKYFIKPVKIEELLQTLLKVGTKRMLLRQNKHIEETEVFLHLNEQTEIQLMIRKMFSGIAKEIFGKGPKKIDVAFNCKKIVVNAFEGITTYETSLIESGLSNSYINLKRELLYKEFKERIESELTNIFGITLSMSKVVIDSNNKVDRLEFSFSQF